MKKSPNRFLDFLWRHAIGLASIVMVLFVLGVGVVGYNYVVITRKFDSSRRWDLPSRIYSDATPIVPGLHYPKALIEPKLNHVGYKEVKGPLANPGDYRYDGDNLEIYLQSFEYPDMEFHGMPVRIEMDGDLVRRIRRVEDSISLRAVRIEPELITSIYDDVMEDRLPISLRQVPQVLVDAVIATEDRDFRHHEGISISGILRAIVTNYRSGAVRAGGSTLTQQLVKNLYLTQERSYKRKIREILMALILETRYSKDDILEGYLNEIYLGQNGSVQIVGVEEASQVYFSKRVSNLTLPEAAMLAGIIRSPNVYSPFIHPDRAKARRDLVLTLMRDQKMITPEQCEAGIASPLTSSKFPKSINSAPFFVDLVLKQLRETYPETQLKTEGLRIFTTLDTIVQRSAERALNTGITSLKKNYSHLRSSPSPLEGVVLTIEPGTGYVKGLVGGTSYRKSQFNRAFQARRQPGSLFKPFVYVAAMDPLRKGEALTAASILDDEPISVRTGSSVWSPQNYDGKFHGRVSVRRALAMSYNIPAVRAAINAGVPNVIKLAARIGVNSRLEPYPSISLGSFEVSPLEIAYAYSVFANEGVKAEPITILAVATHDGTLLENREVQMKRVAPAGLCWVMDDILKDVLVYGTAGAVHSSGFRRPYAGKTGTTNNYRDAWFIGYSPRILTLVWVGFDDGHSVRLSGGAAAVPIWISHMNRIAGMFPDVDFRRPEEVVGKTIDPESGQLATPYCPESKNEVFVAGTEPETLCPIHNRDFQQPMVGEPSPSDEPGMIAEAGTEPPIDQERQARREERRKKAKGLRKFFPWLFD
ncbi:MAG TPA: PBP1A family penicillin-binding protein [Thermoanaerobaculia bacterium]|nr:PBP1A family penicillin-binding protein [Thermoanaerobaculia bacterium]